MGIVNFLKKIKGRLSPSSSAVYDFNESNPMGDNGERVDFIYKDNLNFDKLDMYQKSHFRRYEFACQHLTATDTVGDFACGTGYGTAMISKRVKRAIGADLNKKVIDTIVKRYGKYKNAEYLTLNLLNLHYKNTFNKIISFETIEHFKETDILKLINLYNEALQSGGLFIFSTPYMQEDTEVARKMGFHLTFDINEGRIDQWLETTSFKAESFHYQRYADHDIHALPVAPDFIICVARKIN